ncbi:MAG TPA: protoporphyrinogen oxidase, partial [Actinomycetota bacterium]|nr:protoporphyrinogen oxidase [Actinomycetota bacterium]
GSLSALLRSRVLSWRGLVRAAGDVVIPGKIVGDDVSLGGFVRRRFGNEVAERLVDPLMAGTRAGDIDRMSMRMAAEPIFEAATKHRSVTLALGRAKRGQQRPRFLGLKGGMSRLVDALAERSDADVHLSTPVRRVTRSGAGFVVEADDVEIEADAVVVAVPAHAAASVLADVAPSAARRLADFTFASVSVVNLLYPPGAVRVPSTGSGLLVPRSERASIAACTWVSSKWPDEAPADGRLLLRCVVGRGETGPEGDISDDDDIVARASADVRRFLGAEGDPIATAVHRWERALPRFVVGHRARVAAIENELAEVGNLSLVGAGYTATGLNDCLLQGLRIADSIASARD